MQADARKDFLKFAYLSQHLGAYVYCTDNGRFINHSSKNPNLDIVLVDGESETRGITNRDILSGEEILLDYRLIDARDAQNKEAYLASS